MKYVAGYVAYRFRASHPELVMSSSQNVLKPSEQQNDWINFISRGKLTHPSSTLVDAACILEEEFKVMHGTGLSNECRIFDNLAKNVSRRLPSKLPQKVLMCLVRTRTYIRVRELNKQLKDKALANKQKRKKMKKVTNCPAYFSQN